LDIKLHFPAVLPTYAKFNYVFKNYIENTHERVLNVIRGEDWFNLINPEIEDKKFDGEVKWLIEEFINMKEVFEVKNGILKDVLSRFDQFFAN
jgi:hypothetical protein